MSEPRRPWDKLEQEPSDSFELFSRWLQEPGVGLSEFAVSNNRNPVSLARLAATWRWKARKDAYVHDLHQLGVMAAQEQARDLGRDAALALGDLLDLARTSAHELRASGKVLNARDILAIAAEAAKQAQLASGKPTARVDLSAMDPAVIDALDSLLGNEPDRN